MKAVVCRVQRAKVHVQDTCLGSIDRGLLAYIGVIAGDRLEQAQWLAAKLASLRIFPDEQGKMNRSVADIGGGLLLVPNFTLAARSHKGTRPSFTDAALPPVASPLFDALVAQCRAIVPTACGQFGADMQIDSLADGPVTIILDSTG